MATETIKTTSAGKLVTVTDGTLRLDGVTEPGYLVTVPTSLRSKLPASIVAMYGRICLTASEADAVRAALVSTQTPRQILDAQHDAVCRDLSAALDLADGAYPGSSRWLAAQPKINAANAARATWEANHADYLAELAAEQHARAEQLVAAGI